MRFSDAFLRQLRDRVSIADYAGRKLTWDQRKSRPPAGDFWACCPFHQEKSPSFHVLDNKGLFNCFGCGEKGDVFGLAMKLEGLSFPEAVAMLAEREGMALPVEEPEDRAASDARRGLVGVMEKAAALYRDALGAPEGKAARAYLMGRGLDAAVCERFGIGFAPGRSTWLMDKLRAAGVSADAALAAGLVKRTDDDRLIDVFRDRITFEIADGGGKVIAFGARALDPNAPAKYINSPQTALFDKGRTLYRLKQARELVAKTKADGLVIAEGYLDVIAFERAGIGAVAPMGTSLTEDQLALAWRAGPAPLLCFDGDSAGKRAAARALDLALPHIGPGKTVKIALLPQGEDPDDLFRRAGPDALAPMLAAAKGAAEALFDREKDSAPLSTPEAKASFKSRLKAAAGKIGDEETKRLYMRELLSKADALLRPEWKPNAWRSGGKGGDFRKNAPAPLTAELRAKSTIAASPVRGLEDLLRAAVDEPAILEACGEWIDRLALPDPDLAAIRAAIQALSSAESAPPAIDRAALSRHLEQSGEERALARISRWPKPAPVREDRENVEAQILARMTLEVILPSIQEEMAALRPKADAGDSAAFELFQALSREARALKAQALEAGLAEPGEKVA